MKVFWKNFIEVVVSIQMIERYFFIVACKSFLCSSSENWEWYVDSFYVILNKVLSNLPWLLQQCRDLSDFKVGFG